LARADAEHTDKAAVAIHGVENPVRAAFHIGKADAVGVFITAEFGAEGRGGIFQ
jgi:hypothetical protein